jgi:hypothetical protein
VNHYKLVIKDVEISRFPQTIIESEVVEAHTAEDAVTIARYRHKVPSTETRYGAQCWRTIVDIVCLMVPAAPGSVK